MKKILGILLFALLIGACQPKPAENTEAGARQSVELPVLTRDHAAKILALPLHCLELEYPNKLGQVLGSDADLKSPKALRPIFYGCFDWHSSVHGFWSTVAILKRFPELDQDQSIRKRLDKLITEENCKVEMAFFEDANNRNFERTYGWAWLFQLHSELATWDDPDAQRWAKVLEPLADLLIKRYEAYLPKLLYPIRTGTHDNTAFGLSLSLDYARTMDKKDFANSIIEKAKNLYQNDKGCQLSYEPSGHDFLSPCLEEAHLMGKVLEASQFEDWFRAFLPELYDSSYTLEVARVSDRSDGHLVHLDGLNFSRANCLNQIGNKVPELQHLKGVALKHFEAAFGNISNDDYMGSHWLGTFALYALIHF